MIKVSRKGYLYRFALWRVGFNDWEVEDNLCPFVRQVLVGFFITMFGLPWLVAVLLMFTLLPWSVIPASIYIGEFSLFVDFGSVEKNIIIYTISSILNLLMIGAAVDELYKSYGHLLPSFGRPEFKKPQLPECASSTLEVFKEYSDSVHDKFCPKIEIID